MSRSGVLRAAAAGLIGLAPALAVGAPPPAPTMLQVLRLGRR